MKYLIIGMIFSGQIAVAKEAPKRKPASSFSSLQEKVCFKAINDTNSEIAYLAAKQIFVAFDTENSKPDFEVYKVFVTKDLDGQSVLDRYDLAFRLNSKKHGKAPCSDYTTTSYGGGDFFYQVK
ncbi:MAG: hypothetical protein P4L58_01645 [Candidatus Pacebacteria bacterium]|nr:hypothetical protein [Candidatus Paceibacterota bacterium]